MTRYAYLLYLIVGFCCLIVVATGCNFEPTQTLQAATPADCSNTDYQGGVADEESLRALFLAQTDSQDLIAGQEQSADLTTLEPSTSSVIFSTVLEAEENPVNENHGNLKLVVGQLPTGEVFYRFTPGQPEESIDTAFDGMVYVNGQWRNFPRSSN